MDPLYTELQELVTAACDSEEPSDYRKLLNFVAMNLEELQDEVARLDDEE